VISNVIYIFAQAYTDRVSSQDQVADLDVAVLRMLLGESVIEYDVDQEALTERGKEVVQDVTSSCRNFIEDMDEDAEEAIKDAALLGVFAMVFLT
jgi:hypothetical protein